MRLMSIPSGELTVCYGTIHHFLWENPLFLWPFSIAMLVHQRVIESFKGSEQSSHTKGAKVSNWRGQIYFNEL